MSAVGIRALLLSVFHGARNSKAVLLAAGRGKRLGALTDNTPKPMLEVAGKPLIGHIVDALANLGVRDIAIVTGYLAAHIDDWCARHVASIRRCDLTTLHQAELNGTGGAMLLAKNFVARRECLHLRMGRHLDG